jgi:hypothetical protein
MTMYNPDIPDGIVFANTKWQVLLLHVYSGYVQNSRVLEII